MKKFSLLFVLLLIATAMNVYAQNPPASLQILDYDYHNATLSVTANASGDNILIAITDAPKYNAWDQIIPGGTFGTPSGTYQVGDEITGGGTIVYVGAASNTINITDLTDNVIYHFQAWSMSGGNYSANYAVADFLTWGKVPYTSHFALTELAYSPFGWTVEGGDIYVQPNSWGNFWLQQATIDGSPSNPAIMSLTTQWILLGARNELSFRYYMAVPTFGSFWYPLTRELWEDGSSFEIQLSDDDINYVTIYTINKDNAHDFVEPKIEANLDTLITPPFANFAGQLVKVRIKWHFVQKVQTFLEDIHIVLADIGECDGVYDLTVNGSSLLGGKAEISWSSYDEDADLWEVRYRNVDAGGEWSTPIETSTNPYLLTGLPFETRVEVQVRVKCSAESFSDWTSLIFTSGPEFPPCEYPVSLNVTEITSTTAKLSWQEGNDQNLSWDIRYRDASTTSWNDVEALNVKTYLLEDLTPNTAYLWSVRANCTGDRVSNWATQSNFTTLPLGISGVQKETMIVYASGKMLNIINSENRFIEKVQFFSIDGKLLGDYVVNATDNVLIPTTLNETILFVKIIGKEEFTTHKVLMK